MNKGTELLQEAARLRKIGYEALDKAKELEKQYNSLRTQERRATMTQEERDLEDRARAAEGVCSCICGCRQAIRGGYVYAGHIQFGTCDGCDICS